MALERELPFWISRLRYAAGVDGAAPLFGSESVWMGAEPDHVALRWRSHLQRLLDRGDPPSSVLGLLPALEACEATTVRVELPRRGDVHDALVLELPALLATAGDRVLAIAPGTGASWPGATREQALEGLTQRLTLELLSRDDLGDGASLLELLRVRSASAEVAPETLHLPTFGEVRAARAARDRLLPAVTRPLPTGPEPAVLVDREVEAVARAVDADRSVLLVGAHGSGKSAVSREWARARAPAQLGDRPLREVDAPGLLLALLERGFDWQGPLATLVAELDRERAWLLVGSLAEWFEVGRYAGNDTSLGEQLRTPIARRQVRLLAECTPEDLARLEARYPGHLEGWQRVTVPVAEGGATTRDVCRAWVARRAAGPRIDDDAVTELLRLHQRFAPYSGQPGRALRALRAAADGAPEGQGVDRDGVIGRFCAESGLPRELVDPQAPFPTERIRGFFEARLFGQPAAIDAMVDVLAAAKADVARWGRPLASLLLVGPTGVGKTETARATAELLFGSASRMVRFDMSEVATPWAVSRLVDGPDGEGALTVAVRRQPFSVVLFDEVEKAHPAFLDLLLQILGEGRLTDGRGRTADWSSTVVLLTSNVGSAEAARGTPGLGRDGAGEARARYHDAVGRWLRPELRNRLDRVLVFDPLPAAAVARVLDRELEALARRPGLAHAPLQLSDEARAHLARAGHHPRWGARELLRVLHHEVAAPLARALDEWPEPTPPRLRVDATPEGLRVKATPGDRGARDDLGDADHLRATAARSRLAAVARGGAVAELAARIQDDGRRAARGERVPATTHRALLADVRAALDDARTLERQAGRAALRGRQEPGVPGALDALERRSLELGRALVAETEPATTTCVVGVYGRHHVGPLARLFQGTAEAHGLRATPARVWLRAVKVKEGAFWVEGTQGERPELGVEVGVELLLEGPAAALLFAREDQLWQVGTLDAMRARVVSAAGGRAHWGGQRPAEPHRRSFFTGTPARNLLVDRRSPDPGASWARDVAAAFEAAVFAALA